MTKPMDAGPAHDRTPAVPPASPLGDEDAVLELLQGASRRLVAMTASALAQLEAEGATKVSLPEYRVLVLLASGDARRPSELADDLQVTRPAIAQILGRLVSARLLSRRTDRADRRSYVLTLTPKGARVVEAVLAERERRLRPALAVLSGDDRRALGAALAHLGAALTTARPKQRREQRT